MPRLGQASAAPVLTLEAGDRRADVWSSVQVAFDPGREAGWRELEARHGAFAAPTGPRANFGSQRDAVWMRLQVRNLSPDPRWVLHIDYPLLKRIDVHLVRDGQEVLHQRLGSSLPYAQRPVPTRAHAVELLLPALQEHVVYVRIETSTAMVVPISLLRPDALVQQTADAQLLQGLLLGLALALLVYGIVNALALRDPIFVQYVVMVAGVTVFFAAYSGIGQQYLWRTPGPLVDKIAPLSMLVMLAAASLFVSTALKLPQTHPRLNRVFQGLSVGAVVCVLLSLAGVLDYRTTQLLSSSLGPVPLLLAVPIAWQRARAGDASARWLVLGWGAYLIGALVLTGLLRGLLPVGFWVQHAFQFATTVEMVLWVGLLGVRVQAARRLAERAELERSTLLSMAETDALTSLPNRRGLQRAMRLIVDGATAERCVAIYLLDLDGFKPVNDRLGHEAGDHLLVQVARRLRGVVRAGDVVGRLGGDEFVVVASGLRSDSEALVLGNKLLSTFGDAFEVQGSTCRVGATIGFALCPHDGLDPWDVLKRADAAMYAAKQAGGRSVRRGGASPGLVTPVAGALSPR